MDINMQMKCSKRLLPFILCMMLTVAMAFCTTGCNGKTDDGEPSSVSQTEKETGAQADGTVLGEGNTQFLFTVVDKEGNETQHEIHTDKETVGEALQELDMIAGEESEFGLYVKTVNGITVDYDTDGVYWAFYVNDEYAQAGVDATTISEGDSYSFKVE